MKDAMKLSNAFELLSKIKNPCWDGRNVILGLKNTKM